MWGFERVSGAVKQNGDILYHKSPLRSNIPASDEDSLGFVCDPAGGRLERWGVSVKGYCRVEGLGNAVAVGEAAPVTHMGEEMASSPSDWVILT